MGEVKGTAVLFCGILELWHGSVAEWFNAGEIAMGDTLFSSELPSRSSGSNPTSAVPGATVLV